MAHRTVSVAQAAQAIQQGQVIAYPTEAVWGLGCDPLNQAAVSRILDLKQRPVEKGLIIVAASLQQLKPYLADSVSEQECQRLLPSAQPTTWLVPFNRHYVPEWIHGQHTLLAVRISAHPIVQQLCSLAAMPIVSTSANPQSQEAARTAEQVHAYFADKLLVCEGQCGGAVRPSKIRNLKTGETMRE